MRHFLAAALLAASPALGGVTEALDAHILPGYAGFAEASAALAEAAGADCTAPALAAPYHAAFDAWMRVGDIRMGPSEHGALAIVFWPDARGFTQKTLQRLIAAQDPVIDDPAAFADVSIAGRGLFALDMLLFDTAFSGYAPQSYACRLAQRLTADLAAQAAALDAEWADSFAAVLRSAGAPDNATYLSEQEAVRALYTQILSSLEFTRDSRLGNPLGTFERPRPARAEARRSGRSLRNAVAATDAAVEFAEALADWELPATRAALDLVHEAADKIGDPAFADIDDLGERFKVEVLQQKIQGVETAIEEEIGLVLGLQPGFNSQDGD
ncbi:imelysin family protein [Sinisalibacter aestuarii]|uniref:Signal peptidase n=1 Tax=Sinisalibacter aestuarii TaxID=2949426 RepID=A0ABQ5LP08_9RHOB|nr:imelysin family protein [Sinisalibacter aestuarii]GKY86730.1 signal peptidase [Sinisalibacter aestuarii]